MSLVEKNLQPSESSVAYSEPHANRGVSQLFENQLVNYKKAALYLCVSERYLRKLKSAGRIAFVQVGSRSVRFRVSSLNRYINEREIL